jgi:hypothetical protein
MVNAQLMVGFTRTRDDLEPEIVMVISNIGNTIVNEVDGHNSAERGVHRVSYSPQKFSLSLQLDNPFAFTNPEQLTFNNRFQFCRKSSSLRGKFENTHKKKLKKRRKKITKTAALSSEQSSTNQPDQLSIKANRSLWGQVTNSHNFFPGILVEDNVGLARVPFFVHRDKPPSNIPLVDHARVGLEREKYISTVTAFGALARPVVLVTCEDVSLEHRRHQVLLITVRAGEDLVVAGGVRATVNNEPMSPQGVSASHRFSAVVAQSRYWIGSTWKKEKSSEYSSRQKKNGEKTIGVW